jgi:hypothetical protein
MKLPVVCAALVAGAAVVALGEYSGSYVVPLDHEAIQYSKRPVTDAVTRLAGSLASGKATLKYEENTGYLRSVLEAFDVPVESQVLVFSKTSFQAPRIAPGTPRALYFNDEVAIGYVRGGDVVEVTAQDPRLGTIFYTLDQDPAVKPDFVRRDTACLQCHASGGTAGVPGLFVRSVYPEPTGMPLFQAGSFVTDHRSPFKERWGGWYVTGKHGSQFHMGNAFARDRNAPDQLDREGTQNVTSLEHRFDTGAYLSPHSDIVALMVLEHQTRMGNILTRLGWETRMAIHSQAEMNRILKRPENELSESAERRIGSGVEEVLGYMLFTDESPLTEPVSGTSEFTKVFASRGPLREFDLKTRLFRLPCSYMIYSETFDALPVAAKDRLYRRLWQVLNGEDKSAKFAKITAEQRKEILETLQKTKKGLPDYWKAST